MDSAKFIPPPLFLLTALTPDDGYWISRIFHVRGCLDRWKDAANDIDIVFLRSEIRYHGGGRRKSCLFILGTLWIEHLHDPSLVRFVVALGTTRRFEI